MNESEIWSVPEATGKYPVVKPISSPRLPVFFGPDINIPPLYPAVDIC